METWMEYIRCRVNMKKTTTLSDLPEQGILVEELGFSKEHSLYVYEDPKGKGVWLVQKEPRMHRVLIEIHNHVT
jgi:hypothetical protein